MSAVGGTARAVVCAAALLCGGLWSAPAKAQNEPPPPDSIAGIHVLERAVTEAARSLLEGVPPSEIVLESSWPSTSTEPSALDARLRTAVRRAATSEGAGGPPLVVSAEVVRRGIRVELSLATRLQDRSWVRRLFVAASPATVRVVQVPLDASLRRYVAGIARLTNAGVVAIATPLPARGYLAAQVVNLDGEGPEELVLLRDGDVEVFRVAPGARAVPRMRRIARVPLPRSPRPGHGTPRPFGTLSVDTAPDGSVSLLARVRSRASVTRIHMRDGEVEATEATDPCPALGHPLEDACAVPVDARDYFASELMARVGHSTPPRAPTSFLSRRLAQVVRADGTTDRVEAVVTPRGRLVVQTGTRAVGVAGHGAAFGMADLDDDGMLELLASSAAPIGEPDRLTLYRVTDAGGMRTLWRSDPIAGSVLVGTHGDLDGDGRPELFAIEEGAEGTQLWWVR